MNALCEKPKRISLLRNITVFVFLISLSPLLIMGLPSIISTSNMLRQRTIDSQIENIRQGAFYIDLVMNDVESLIANLSGLDEVNDALLHESDGSTYDKLLTQAKIGYTLSGYTNLKGLVSIDLYSKTGAHYHVGETLNVSDVNSEIIDRYFREAETAGEDIRWNGIEESLNRQSKHGHLIIASRLLAGKGPGGQPANGLLVVSYDPAVFDAVFGTRMEKGAFSSIVDARQRIVFHPDPKYIGKAMSQDIVDRMDSPQGYFETNIGGQQMLVVYSRTLKGGWAAAEFIPTSSIMEQINYRIIILSFLVIFGVMGALNFIRVVSKRVVVPIKMITETFKSLQAGDFQHADKLTVLPNDEIGDLGELFNSFIDAREDITTQKKLERRLNEQNRELQEALDRLKITQTQLIQQEKLAGIGQLAAGVAHEINNPLGYIIANFSLIGKYVGRFANLMETVEGLLKGHAALPDQSAQAVFGVLESTWRENRIDDARAEMQEINADIAEGLSRIAKIVTGLKSFSRVSQPDEWGSYDMNSGIEATLLIASNELKYNAAVRFRPGEIPAVMANGGQINQVLLNILINAVHAIKQKYGQEKGVIEIDTFTKGGYVCCDIRDDGCGMAEEVMNRVFEPFFTTKPAGQGTGLGLGIAYDIVVNKHRGMLEVSSTPGEGSRFRLRIPIGQEDSPVEAV